MTLLYILGILFVVNLLIWRKLMSTSTDLTNTATALATAANAMAATATAVTTLIKNLQSGQLIDQATLDAVNTSLSSSLSAIQAAQTELQSLVPTTPAA